MIFIFRALSQVRKGMMDYDSPTSRDETPDEKKKKRKAKKREGPKKYKKLNKMREKERRGNATILLPHLCFKVAP